MGYHKLDGYLFSQMIHRGANNLERNAAKVDALNVFPVPDGDTGTNMNLSFNSGVQEMNKCKSKNIAKVSKALSKGLLMGARGNSGVILSQLFRGFGKAIENQQELSAYQFALALQRGVETAYRAVMKPVEGTILTVAKDAAKAGLRKAKVENDITEVMSAVLGEARNSLERTPELLPILKQVGVVDSGGQGLVYVYEGFLSVLQGDLSSGEALEEIQVNQANMLEDKEDHVRHEVSEMIAAGVLTVEDIVYGYCTEFIIRLDKNKIGTFNEDKFRQDISQWGDSLLIIADEELVKIHIHAEKLDRVLHLAQSFGQLTNIKIENMREQFLAMQEKSPVQNGHKEADDIGSAEVLKPYGLLTVSMGAGVEEIFKSLGADIVISGGQTMNPSTQDFVQASKQIKAEKIIILPNNSNIILAAEQAAQLIEVPVLVLPTKNIPQGLAALLSFKPNLSLDRNKELMLQAKEQVIAGQVTYAIRDSSIDGREIKEGEFMGLVNGKITNTATDIFTCTTQLIQEMITDESEIITLIYGEDVNTEDAEHLLEYLENKYPELDIEIHNGRQPIYAYLISVE